AAVSSSRSQPSLVLEETRKVTSGGKKTAADLLFEQYLVERGLADFEFEPPLEGITTAPDYRVSVSGNDLFFEVKEFEAPDKPRTGNWFNAAKAIRAKINEAQKQLKPLKGKMCGIVLANP